MAEYINRQAFLDHMKGTSRYFAVKFDIESFPVADVAPVVHGRWLHTDLAYHWTSLDECSVCGYHDEKRQHLGNYSYCPNCGAKMDGGDGDE